MSDVHERVPGLADAVLRAQRLLRAAGTAEGLRASAAAVAAAARSVDCSVLMPASPSARGVVSAAVLLSDGALSEAADCDVLTGSVGKVLLVEVAAISGLIARSRANALREAGAGWVGLVVLHDLAVHGGQSEDRYGDLDELVLSA